MSKTITIPDFDFSAFYYPEILDALMKFKRANVPELTEELDEEPFMQFHKAVALVGHLNNVLIDRVANESTLPTAKLVDQVREMLKLIGYVLSPASPSQCPIIYKLSKVFNASFEVISERAQASIKREGDNPIIIFEALEALEIERTDQFSYVFSIENGIFTDYTTKANSAITPGDDWTPWATPAAGDCIYWGHKQVMWDKLSLYLTTFAQYIDGIFEFYEGNWTKESPESVTDIGGGSLRFDLTPLLGDQNRQGTTIRVTLNSTSSYQTVTSYWNGSANVVDTGYIGQTSPSLDADAYSIGTDWTEIDDAIDGTENLSMDGDVDFSLPQSINKNWIKTIVDDASAYWIRYRIISVSTPVAPVFINSRMDEGKQYVYRLATQGQTRLEILGNSTGVPNQRFEFSQENFISNSDTVYVNDEAWARVDNFLGSKPTDKHYAMELITNDRGVVVFGDGVTGKIPVVGVGNISAEYRYGANNDGNVGANTVTVDKTGLTYVDKLWNPRQAIGWSEAQGASERSLEKAKIAGPASLRIKDVALNASEVATMTLDFRDADGSKLYSRAYGIEEGYGPKTIELVVVTKGGSYASADQLETLQLYFNGNKNTHPQVASRLVMNQQVIATNYTQRTINIDIDVWGDVDEDSIISILQKKLHPEALQDDNINWLWDFEGEISLSRLNHEIFIDGVTKIVFNSPSADIVLVGRELPILGTVNVNIH